MAAKKKPAPKKICIYAFSSTALFFRALMDECKLHGDAVEWSVITPQGHFRNSFAGEIPPERRCYLYENFAPYYAAAGAAPIDRALSGGEGLVLALLKDKDGYRWLDKEEQVRRGAAIYACYREFLERVRPDFVMFPILEVVDGAIVVNICRDLGIGVLYYTSMRFLGVSYFGPDPYETLPPYFGGYTKPDVTAARAIIGKFKSRAGNEPASSYPPSAPPKPFWLRRLVASECLRWRHERLHASEESLRIRLVRPILGFMIKLRRRRFELLSARYFDLRGDETPLPGKFLLYALHFTPEASINTSAPYYVDQLRAIDMLLVSLPQGHRLLVKEHPAMYGRRPAAFYRALRRRPGLVLVHPACDTRRLIARASVVATVSGTVGLESFLLGKPCVLFGESFFAHLCHPVPALRELRGFLERLIATYKPPNEARKEIEIAKFVNIGGDFLIADPWFRPTVMAPENIRAARAYLWRHLERLGKATKT